MYINLIIISTAPDALNFSETERLLKSNLLAIQTIFSYKIIFI